MCKTRTDNNAESLIDFVEELNTQWKGISERVEAISQRVKGMARTERLEALEWKSKAQELEKKLKQAHKDFGCELRDPYGTIWEYAEKLKERVDKAEREAEEWKAKAQELEEKLKWAEWAISLSLTAEGKHGKEG